MGPPQQSFTVQNAQELMDRLDDTGCAAAPAGHGPEASLLRCCYRSGNRCTQWSMQCHHACGHSPINGHGRASWLRLYATSCLKRAVVTLASDACLCRFRQDLVEADLLSGDTRTAFRETAAELAAAVLAAAGAAAGSNSLEVGLQMAQIASILCSRH